MRGRHVKRSSKSKAWRAINVCSFLRSTSRLSGTLVLLLSFLVVCLWAGCESQDSAKMKAARAKETKAVLLQQLDKKFENPDVHCKLGQLYCEEGRFGKAEYHFKTALEFDPVHRPTQAAMVKMSLDSGDKANAKLYADTYMKQASGSETESLQLGQAFEKQGLAEYALACYNQALALSPDSPAVNKQMGFYYLSKADKARAQEYLTRSFQANPNQPDVARELGRLGVVVETPRMPQKDSRKSQDSSGQKPPDSAKAKGE